MFQGKAGEPTVGMVRGRGEGARIISVSLSVH